MKYIFCVILFFLLALSASGQSLKDTVSVIGVGDIMMGSNYPEGNALPPSNGQFLLQNVKDVLASADITFGNLEGVLLDEGGTPKTCRDPKVCYVFRSPVAFAQNLVDAGFDIMSLANNHAGDFGDVGRQSSMKTLEDAGLYYAGQTQKPFVTFTKDSIRYGFAAFAPNSNCIDINDLEGAQAIVHHLDSISDIVIISFHGGAEGAQYQHVPRTEELFHGENRGDVYKFAHTLIDAGADIIFGHGPHVTRAIEVYKERFIAYSMGNFCTYGGINVAGVNGLAPIVKVQTSRTGIFYQAQVTATYQTNRAPVNIDPQKQVIRRIQELSKQDFPENPVTIADDGVIKYSTR